MGENPSKASPERGGARDMRAEGFVPPHRKGRGGSVSRRDHSQATGNRAQRTGAYSLEEEPTRTPAALREKGSGEEGLLSEKPPPPQNLPSYSPSYSPPEFPTAPSSLVLSTAMGGRRFLLERRKSCEGAFGRLTRRNRPWDGSASLGLGALDPQKRCCQS